MARVNSTQVGQVVDGSSLEVVGDQSFDPVIANEFGASVTEEVFMNEYVTVVLADTTDENAPPHVMLSCNGTTQPLMRNIPTMIRRKYVEILARCKESKFSQRQASAMEPDRIEMIQRTALAYPFEVIEDKNPKGRAWLRGVMAEAA